MNTGFKAGDPNQSNPTAGGEPRSEADDAIRSAPTAASEQRARALAALGLATSFMQIVTVLMRSDYYRHYTLADLEWLVVAPLMAGQFSIAQDKASRSVAVALWASVSAEVDQRLSDQLQQPIRLEPDDWRSGDILWIIDVAGEPRLIPKLREKLIETAFKGREAKMRVRDENGTVTVHRIASSS